MKKTNKTIAQQLNVTDFPIITLDVNDNKIYFEDSDGYWEKYEYDENGNKIYFEDSDGFWEKYKYDENGTHIYFEDSDGYIEDNRNIPELPKEELSNEESPEEAFHRLIKDESVLKASKQYGCAGLTRDVMYIVLNGSIMTDEYYSELMDVINVINKLNYIHFTVTIEYPYFHEF